MSINNEVRDLVAITEMTGDNILDILFRGDEYSDDYVWCWKERIKEEMEHRYLTGVAIPISQLDQYPRGIHQYPFNVSKG